MKNETLKAEEIWPKLLSLDAETQEKMFSLLSATAKFNLQTFLDNKENKKEIKADTRESELFKLILKREIYQKAATPAYDPWGAR